MKEDWAYIPFAEVCESMTKGPFGSDIKKSLYVPKSVDTYKVYIQANAIEKDASIGEYYISKEYFDTKMFRFEVKPNDYIITCDGTLGKYLRLPLTIERGIISASLLRITLNQRIVPKYFEYLWDGFIMGRLTSDIRNSALVHLPSADKIGKVKIPLPSLSEQERIVAELDLLSGIIDKQNAQLKELDTLARSIFYKMFGNPVDNNKRWDVVDLAQVIRVKGRVGWKGYKKEDLRDSGPLAIGGGHLTEDGSLDLSSPVFLSREKYEESPEIMIEIGDLILVQRGTIGKVGLVKTSIGEATINPCVLILRPIKINGVYALHFFLNKDTQQFLQTLIRGVAQPMITQQQVNAIRVPVPPLSLQQSFAEKIQAIENQKVAINKAITETQTLFDYTMDQYFG